MGFRRMRRWRRMRHWHMFFVLPQRFADEIIGTVLEMMLMLLDGSTCPEVESSPEKVSGAWVFRNTRVPVYALFENLEGGAIVAEFYDRQ